MTEAQHKLIAAAKKAAERLDQPNVLFKTRYYTVIEGKGSVETFFDGTAGVRLWTTHRRDKDGNPQSVESIHSSQRENAEADHLYAVDHFEEGWK